MAVLLKNEFKTEYEIQIRHSSYFSRIRKVSHPYVGNACISRSLAAFRFPRTMKPNGGHPMKDWSFSPTYVFYVNVVSVSVCVLVSFFWKCIREFINQKHSEAPSSQKAGWAICDRFIYENVVCVFQKSREFRIEICVFCDGFYLSFKSLFNDRMNKIDGGNSREIFDIMLSWILKENGTKKIVIIMGSIIFKSL